MTARERILSLRLLERQERNPWFIDKIGVSVSIKEKDDVVQASANHMLELCDGRETKSE